MKRIAILLAIIASAVTANAQQQLDFDVIRSIDSSICFYDSLGIHFLADLDIKEQEVLEAAVVRIVEEFNANVAALWHKWTPEEMRQFTTREREIYKDAIEDYTKKLFIGNADSYYTHEISSYKVYKRNGLYYYQDQNRKEHRAYNPQYDSRGTLRQNVEEDISHLPARIEITSKYRKSSILKEVRKYLNNIRNSNYERVEFNAGDIKISKKLKRNAEGRYEGVISYYQVFKGYRFDGGFYSDTTFRTVTFYVDADEQIGPDNIPLIVWRIRLGDIRATATK